MPGWPELGQVKGQVCTHLGVFCSVALIKSLASSLRWAAMGLLHDTRPSKTFSRVARSLSPAKGDEQVRLKAGKEEADSRGESQAKYALHSSRPEGSSRCLRLDHSDPGLIWSREPGKA